MVVVNQNYKMLSSPKNTLAPQNSENCNLIVFVDIKKTYSIDVEGNSKAIAVEVDADSQVSNCSHAIKLLLFSVITVLNHHNI